MLILDARRALVGAALCAIAGCAGGSSSSSTPIAFQGGAFVHRGVPFAPALRRRSIAPLAGSHSFPINRSLVFEADQDQTAVNIYVTADLPSNPAPVAAIHVAAGCPYGMAKDKKGTLYVVDNCGGNDVEEYPKGQTTLKTTITDGISNPLGAAIDKSGNLYVSNYPAAITVYPFGSTTPSETITGGGMEDPFGLALDRSNNLYIADFGASQVFEVPAGTTTVTPLNLQDLTEPLGVAVDFSTGYLWVTDGGGNKINVYQLPSTSPIESIPGTGFPYAISVQNHGQRRGSVIYSDISTATIYAFKPGQYTPYATLTNGISLPTGALLAKPNGL